MNYIIACAVCESGTHKGRKFPTNSPRMEKRLATDEIGSVRGKMARISTTKPAEWLTSICSKGEIRVCPWSRTFIPHASSAWQRKPWSVSLKCLHVIRFYGIFGNSVPQLFQDTIERLPSDYSIQRRGFRSASVPLMLALASKIGICFNSYHIGTN